LDDFIYNNIIDNIAQEFERLIGNIKTVYNFDYGNEFEISVCKFLRKFLPLKYGICRGFVIDKDGNRAGDDIIIYDQELYPTLRFLEPDNQFAKKEQIPVEAVYAYIEAKYTLNSDSLKKAVKQVGTVKKLCYSRSAVIKRNIKKDCHIFNNEYSKANGWKPIISNPIYGMILSANCVDDSKKRAENGEDATKFVLNEIQNNLKSDIHDLKFYSFDSIIAGNSTTVFCGHDIFDKEGSKINGILLTRFYTGIQPGACYQVSTHENLAFGLSMAHLMMALNYIQLGDMPWDMIFNTAKMPDKVCREKFVKIIEDNKGYGYD
jgi:hypothetical protein